MIKLSTSLTSLPVVYMARTYESVWPMNEWILIVGPQLTLNWESEVTFDTYFKHMYAGHISQEHIYLKLEILYLYRIAVVESCANYLYLSLFSRCRMTVLFSLVKSTEDQLLMLSAAVSHCVLYASWTRCLGCCDATAVNNFCNSIGWLNSQLKDNASVNHAMYCW